MKHALIALLMFCVVSPAFAQHKDPLNDKEIDEMREDRRLSRQASRADDKVRARPHGGDRAAPR